MKESEYNSELVMVKIIIVVIGIVLTLSCFYVSCKTAIVSTSQGQLRGLEYTTINKHTYYKFRGIPYAKPPVKDLRFKPPQSPEPWDGVRDATAEGPVCPQPENPGDEDCLLMNIVTPKLPINSFDSLLPVMMYIHGGSFLRGTGNWVPDGSDYFIEQGVLVVSMNYRLGPLGFLSTGDSVVPGNNGLKDQVMALRWVQQNIVQFGGNPKNITIIGLSAGSASVHYHILSPLSKGLFHQAVAQSGSALNPWAFENTNSARNKALRYGEALGLKTSNSTQLIEFLRDMDTQTILDGVEKAQTDLEKNHAVSFFMPTVERETDEVFLSEHPLDIIKAHKFQHVPFMTGVVTREGMTETLPEVYLDPSRLEYYNNNFQLLLPENLNMEINSSQAQDIARTVMKFYFEGESLSQATLIQYMNLIGDSQFLYGVNAHATMHGYLSEAPVYEYYFSFDGRLGDLKREFGDYFPGAGHSDEEGYLFCFPLPFYDLENSTSEIKTKDRMVALWANFIKTGNPTPDTDPLFQDVVWEPITKLDHFYLHIGNDLAMRRNLHEERIKFWDYIYKSVLLNY